MILRQLVSRRSPAFGDGLAAREAFKAVPMCRAAARKCIVGRPSDSKVTHFRMHEAVKDAAVYHGASSDTRAEGHVDERIVSASCAVHVLSEGGAIHVGVERDIRDAHHVRNHSHEVAVLPRFFGCGGDVTVGWRVALKIHRTKCGETNAGEWLIYGGCTKEGGDFGDGLFRRGGRDRATDQNPPVRPAYSADEL